MTAAPLDCTPDEPVVCVLAEDRLLLTETVARTRPVLERLARVPGAPTRAMPMRDSRDTTVLGVDPGATTPWGEVDREWGGDVNVDLYSVFAPETYCPVGRFDQAPRPVRRAFRGTRDLMAWWLDPGPQHLHLKRLMEEESGSRVRELVERFLASTDDQRDQYAAAVLAAARDCDTAAVRAAADVLAAAPATASATSPTS